MISQFTHILKAYAYDNYEAIERFRRMVSKSNQLPFNEFVMNDEDNSIEYHFVTNSIEDIEWVKQCISLFSDLSFHYAFYDEQEQVAGYLIGTNGIVTEENSYEQELAQRFIAELLANKNQKEVGENMNTNEETTVENEIISIENITGGNLVFSSEFQQVLNVIPQYVQEAQALLDIDINDVDENVVEDRINSLKAAQRFEKKIAQGRKSISNYFDSIKNNALVELDAALDQSQYNELVEADKNVKKLKKDVLNNRKAKRWAELEETFTSNIRQYDYLFELAPELKDFSRFQIMFPKLVSGSKSGKITDKIRKEVIDTVFSWQKSLADIKVNPFEISSLNLMRVLKSFTADPTQSATVLMAEYHQKEEELQEEQRLQELQRLEEEQKRQLESQNVPVSTPAPQNTQVIAPTPVQTTYQTPVEPVQPVAQFPWLIQYLQQNPKYNGIHNNDKLKCSLLYDMYNQLGQQGTFFAYYTQNNPEVVVTVNQYILNL